MLTIYKFVRIQSALVFSSREAFRAGAKDKSKNDIMLRFRTIPAWEQHSASHLSTWFYHSWLWESQRSTWSISTNVEHAEDSAGKINDRVNKRRFGELKQIFQLQRLYAKKRLDGKVFLTWKAALSFDYYQSSIGDDIHQVMLENSVKVCINWEAIKASAGRSSFDSLPAIFGTSSMSTNNFTWL